MQQDNFRRVLLDAVEESLSSLGESSKEAILFHLENSFKVKKEHIPINLTEFANALEGIFGFGASYLEKLILKRLCEKIGVEFEETEICNFVEFVTKVQEQTATNGGG